MHSGHQQAPPFAKYQPSQYNERAILSPHETFWNLSYLLNEWGTLPVTKHNPPLNACEQHLMKVEWLYLDRFFFPRLGKRTSGKSQISVPKKKKSKNNKWKHIMTCTKSVQNQTTMPHSLI